MLWNNLLWNLTKSRSNMNPKSNLPTALAAPIMDTKMADLPLLIPTSSPSPGKNIKVEIIVVGILNRLKQNKRKDRFCKTSSFSSDIDKDLFIFRYNGFPLD